MRIIVCVKQVPATSNVQVDPETGVLKRDGAAVKLNPFDLYGVELALSLREQAGGRITALTMGPPRAALTIEETLYMGVDDGFVLSDRAFAGADVCATAACLAAGVGKAGDFDLIICGKQTTDGDTAQVGPEMAEFLGVEHASYVTAAFDPDPTGISVSVNLGDVIQTQRMAFPCLITVEKEINTPCLPSYRRMKALAGQSTPLYGLADLAGAQADRYGLDGSPTQVERVFPPAVNADRTLYQQGDLAGILVRLLQAGKYV